VFVPAVEFIRGFQHCWCGLVAFSALTLLVEWQEGHPARKKYGGMVEVGTG